MDLTQLLQLLGGQGFGAPTGSTPANPLQNLYYTIARLQGQPHDQAMAFAGQASQAQPAAAGTGAGKALNLGPNIVKDPGAGLLGNPGAGTAGPAVAPTTQAPTGGQTAASGQPTLPKLPALPSARTA